MKALFCPAASAPADRPVHLRDRSPAPAPRTFLTPRLCRNMAMFDPD